MATMIVADTFLSGIKSNFYANVFKMTPEYNKYNVVN